MFDQITLFIPPDIQVGLRIGELTRNGSVVRDAAGRIVAHLKEISPLKPNEAAVEAAARMLKNPVVVATLGVLGTTTAAVAIFRYRRHLAQASSIDLNESPEPTPTAAPVVELRRRFNDAA